MAKIPPKKGSGPSSAKATQARQRRLQRAADHKDENSHQDQSHGAVQAGPRRQPENPMPPQHLHKPGKERDLELAPRFKAPQYKGSGKLEGMRALISGGDSGIGRAVARVVCP